MAYVAMELNDASLAVVRDGELHLDGPGYAAVAGGELRFGDAARPLMRLHPRQAARRFWSELSELPLPLPLADCRTTADLVQRHLARLCSGGQEDDAVVLAVTPHWSEHQLGLLLGIAADLQIPVAGMVDSAIAASRRPYPGRGLWHLEAGLETAWLTRIEQGPCAALGTRIAIERFGIETLERGCAEFLAGRFVACSRFDPLHDARSEQLLFDHMPGWLAATARQQRISMSMEHGGHRFEAWMDSDELLQRVARLSEPAVRQLRPVMSPREPSVLQVQARLADFPGLVEALTLLPACTVVLLEPGAAARGALRLRPEAAPGAAVTLATTLPWDQPAEDTAGLPPTASGGLAPTHVVFGGRAWRLGAEPVQIGTEIGEHDYGILLDARAQAVSRRHCAIQAENGRVIVHDQSRYGTWLNGHRVEGSAVLQPGDVLSIGRPPREFMLIAEVQHGP